MTAYARVENMNFSEMPFDEYRHHFEVVEEFEIAHMANLRKTVDG